MPRNVDLFDMKIGAAGWVILSLIVQIAGASGGKCCYCEIGNWPKQEQFFFIQGCNFWLAEQKNCVTQQIVPENFDYSSHDLACKGGTLSIGYVGHWSSSRQTIADIDNRLAPASIQHQINIRVDNTACSSMSEPQKVQRHLAQIAQSSETSTAAISYRGNQVISVGGWEKILGPQFNLWAKASTHQSDVEFPFCKKFLDRNCLQPFQNGESGFCWQGRELIRLKCCEVPDESEGALPYSTRFAWEPEENCSD